MTEDMKQLVANIAAACEPDATPAQRQLAKAACEALAQAFGTTPGTPLTAAPTAPAPSTPLGQLLDGLIMRLKAELPEDRRDIAPQRPLLDIPFVRVPHARE